MCASVFMYYIFKSFIVFYLFLSFDSFTCCIGSELINLVSVGIVRAKRFLALSEQKRYITRQREMSLYKNYFAGSLFHTQRIYMRLCVDLLSCSFFRLF